MQKLLSSMLLYLCCLFSVIVGMAQDKKSIPAMSSRQKISVVFIGNSITEATYLQETPPMAATSCLQALGYDVKSINCGISGYNSNDFQPGTKAFQKVTCSATKTNQKGSQLIFSRSDYLSGGLHMVWDTAICPGNGESASAQTTRGTLPPNLWPRAPFAAVAQSRGPCHLRCRSSSALSSDRKQGLQGDGNVVCRRAVDHSVRCQGKQKSV